MTTPPVHQLDPRTGRVAHLLASLADNPLGAAGLSGIDRAVAGLYPDLDGLVEAVIRADADNRELMADRLSIFARGVIERDPSIRRALQYPQPTGTFMVRREAPGAA